MPFPDSILSSYLLQILTYITVSFNKLKLKINKTITETIFTISIRFQNISYVAHEYQHLINIKKLKDTKNGFTNFLINLLLLKRIVRKSNILVQNDESSLYKSKLHESSHSHCILYFSWMPFTLILLSNVLWSDAFLQNIIWYQFYCYLFLEQYFLFT